MAGIELVPERATSGAYPVPGTRVSVPVRASLARAATVDQWLVAASLPAGAVLEWVDEHGDEALHLLEGSLLVDGRPCEPGGAVVVEAGARPTITAGRDSRVVHVGPGSAAAPADGPFGAPSDGPRGVHVVGAGGIGGVHDYDGGDKHAAWFTDGTCATCRIMFFRVWGEAGSDGPSHSHSQDELIHLTHGSLRIGATVAGPGSTVAIPADRRYGFRTAEPWGFLNYRRDMSFMSVNPREPAVMETA
jgi:hypothetical protein